MLLGISLTYDDLVFSRLDGKPIRPNIITRARTVLTTRTSLKVIRLHDAMHSHASLMLKQGIHSKIVQERLGHPNIAIILYTYSYVSLGLQEEAAKRFDESFPASYNKLADERAG